MSPTPQPSFDSNASAGTGMEPAEIAIAIVEHAGQYLVGQRPAGVPLAGIYEIDLSGV
jgi:hypothetical protein